MTTTLVTLNLNGIRSAERRGLLKWLDKRKPDVVCVQELRATPQDVEDELRSLGGRQSCWFPAVKKGYAGTAVISKKPPTRYVIGLGFDYLGNEGRAVRADFDDYSVISLYVPSGSSGPERLKVKLAFMEMLLPWTKELLREKRAIALCGDINIAPTALDLARPKQNVKNSGFLPEEREWFAKLLASGWTDTVRAHNAGVEALYSWWSQRGAAREKDIGWRLDHVLTTPQFHERTQRAWIEKDADLSDHAPVCVEFE
ncbi:MAG: exodeoxyribonuclease III [Planctomycetota bacterium]|nr:exodeoxyribonuclease III [Planctomycetota bacterium]